MITPILETDRLILRPIRKEDINPIFNCWMRDENVSRYMFWKATDDIKETEEFVNFELRNIQSDLWYRWIMELKSTSEIIGTSLIYYNDDEGEEHWDISYNLGVKYS